MRTTILSRYIDPDVLNAVADRHIAPSELVIGNLSGAHKSPMSGFAVEFAGHREYVAGDDPKHIDWRVYFNRDKYFIKQYELETNFVCHLLLDVSASMRYGSEQQQKLQYAARMATTLGYSIVRQSDKVSLATFDDRVRAFLPPSNSLGQIVRMTQHLDELEPVEKTNVANSLTDFTSRIGRREIVFIFSDFFCNLEELEQALQRIRYSRHEVVLFHVLHHHEWTFDLEGMTKFVGLEVADELLAEPEELRLGYLRAVERFRVGLQDLALRNRCELVPVDTQRSIAETLFDYLNQRSVATRGGR